MYAGLIEYWCSRPKSKLKSNSWYNHSYFWHSTELHLKCYIKSKYSNCYWRRMYRLSPKFFEIGVLGNWIWNRIYAVNLIETAHKLLGIKFQMHIWLQINIENSSYWSHNNSWHFEVARRRWFSASSKLIIQITISANFIAFSRTNFIALQSSSRPNRSNALQQKQNGHRHIILLY